MAHPCMQRDGQERGAGASGTPGFGLAVDHLDVSGRKYQNSSSALNQELFPSVNGKAIGGPKRGHITLWENIHKDCMRHRVKLLTVCLRSHGENLPRIRADQ